MPQKLNHLLLTVALLAALLLIVTMAIGSKFNRHPDEQLHYAAASFYFSHWLPPAVDDPVVSKVYKRSPWGVSYLNNLEFCYFAAAKFAKLLAQFGTKSYLGLRLFQVFLFSCIVLLATTSRDYPYFFILLLTPQAWYVFSYFNGDAFPLFISFIIGFIISTPKSHFRTYLQSGGAVDFYRGGLPFALCLGFLTLTKKNYYVFILFILFVLIFQLLIVTQKNNWLKVLSRLVSIGLIAVSIFTIRFGYDLYINGWNKKDKVIAAAEKYADDEFKPSIADKQDSYRLMRLKQKGVTYGQLMSEYHWHRESFHSFFGTYGYMEFFNSLIHYRYVSRVIIILLGFMAWIFIFRQDNLERLFTTGTLILILTTIFLSSWHSWVYAFQPQGRYLFPILPMLGVWWRRNFHHINSFVLSCLMCALFSLSIYSFYMVGLGHLK